MDTVIYYYSATGNSLHVAKLLEAGLGKGAVRLPMLRSRGDEGAEAKRVGLVFPLHYYGLPPLVRQFVERLTAAENPYVFGVVTCGSVHLSNGLHQLAGLLEKKGKNLDAGFLVPMVSSYIPLSDIPSEVKKNRKLAGADCRVAELLPVIRAGRKLVEGEYTRFLGRPIYRYWEGARRRTYRKFSCEAGCKGCRICERVCPVGNVRLEAGAPVWRENCQECLACLHFCPEKIINFGSGTRRRSRYHHPAVTVNEIMDEKEPSDRRQEG